MFMVLLIQMIEWGNWRNWFKLGCEWGTGDVYYFIVFVFFLQFCLLFSYILSPLIYVTRAWLLLCQFLCFFFCLWSLLIRTETALSLVQSYFRSQVSHHYSVDFLGKGRMFSFQSPFRVSTLLYTSLLDF